MFSTFSRVVSNVQSVLSQCNTQLRLPHLLHNIEVMSQKTIKKHISVFYSVINVGFLPIRAPTKSYLPYYRKLTLHEIKVMEINAT